MSSGQVLRTGKAEQNKRRPVKPTVPLYKSELSTGRMDPRVGSDRVGSGHDFARLWRVGSGRVSTSDFFYFFTEYFFVPESIWIFEYYIRIELFSTIFNK